MIAAPKVWTVLTNDDGDDALVVAEGTDPLTGLLDLVEEVYGGDRFSPENPAILEALPDVTVGEWRSCTVKWAEGEGIDMDAYNGWWAPHGDGARSIWVLAIPFSAYALGERAEEHEPHD